MGLSLQSYACGNERHVITDEGKVLFPKEVHANERISFNGRMKDGKNIYYWVDSGNSYASRINEAKSKLRYPSGLWNPIVLNRTNTKKRSKMDLYQYYDTSSSANAYTQFFKAKSNGNENIAYIRELDSIEWIYNKILINDYHMKAYDNNLKSTVILHDECDIIGTS